MKETTFNERRAIEEYIDYLKKENDRFTEMYRASREHNMKEYKEAIQRLRVLDDIERKIEKEEVPTLVAQEASPSKDQGMSLREALDQYNKEREAEHTDNDKAFEYNRQEEEKKEQLYKEKKYVKLLDHKQLTEELAVILKKAGRPIKSSELKKQLNDEGYPVTNMYSVLQSAMIYDPKIEQAMRGYYQYKL
ncbi:hypothetical protein CPT_Moonbeam70 [Bacillus phage Moonbeam]|uniref:Repressor Rok winged helix domain-containing protein n=1 Tax=Bacillus phage Moonbeam TaxID=1540091 RepID=A0A0A0RV43_9CAUD|nr:hypothetical protein CPT_Moonbeam70 [Bacillus phage Moonbeam]AIW03468.1 hypothetical protein CPT_Moonbeam70 [Bacillus phage Moonbeam]